MKSHHHLKKVWCWSVKNDVEGEIVGSWNKLFKQVLQQNTILAGVQ